MRGIWNDIIGGVLCSLLSLTYAFSYSGLIFTGPLQPWLAEGIAASLVTAAVTAAIVALTSRIKGAIAGPESSTVAFIAAMTAGMAPMLEGMGEQGFRIGLLAVTSCALLSGLLLFTVARLKLGRIVRFVPYPVLAGFMASVGWTITIGALRMGADAHIDVEFLMGWHPASPSLLALTITFGGFLWFVSVRLRHPLAQPLALLAAIFLTHAALWFWHIDNEAGRRLGIFFAVGRTELPIFPFFNRAFFDIDWSVFAHSLGYIGAVATMTLFSVLMNLTGIETATKGEFDLDVELGASGLANLLSSFLGGYVGYISVSRSLLNWSLGGRGPLAGLIVAAVCAAAIFVGSELLTVLPRFVLAGLLLSVGGRTLWDWAVSRRDTLPMRDRVLMLGIIVVSALSSMLIGLVVGLVGGCLIFALDVGQVRYLVRQSGLHERPSTLLRSAEEMAVLAREGHRVLVLELDNYLFFGTAYRLFEDVARRLSKGDFHTLILDFGHVRGMDSSAAAVFAKVASRAATARCALIFASCSETERRMLEAVAAEVEYFDGLDDALETAESRIIAATMERQSESALSDWLAAALGPTEAASLAPHLARREYLAGAYLCRQGEPTETLLFVESGRLAVLLEAPGEKPRKVRSFTAHTIVGEIGFFAQTPRTASLLVEENAVVWSLDRGTFETLRRRDADSAASLYAYVIRILAERLAFASRQAAAAIR